jgi:hypothetical protein
VVTLWADGGAMRRSAVVADGPTATSGARSVEHFIICFIPPKGHQALAPDCWTTKRSFAS